jgi:hypothetical protein
LRAYEVEILTQQSTTNRIAILRANKYKGAYSRVARKLSCSPSHVRAVAMGIKTSKRVFDALIADARSIEREIEKESSSSAA